MSGRDEKRVRFWGQKQIYGCCPLEPPVSQTLAALSLLSLCFNCFLQAVFCFTNLFFWHFHSAAYCQWMDSVLADFELLPNTVGRKKEADYLFNLIMIFTIITDRLKRTAPQITGHLCTFSCRIVLSGSRERHRAWRWDRLIRAIFKRLWAQGL